MTDMENQKAWDTAALERVLGRLRRAFFLTGTGVLFAVASPAVLATGNTVLLAQIAAVLAFIFVALGILSAVRFRRSVRGALLLSAPAAAYLGYLQNKRMTSLFPTCALSVLCGFAVPRFSYSALLPFLPVALAAVAWAIWLLRFFTLRKLTVTVTEMADVGEERSRRRKRFAIIETVLWWVLTLGLYITASVILQNSVAYIPLVLFSAALRLLRVILINPYSRFAYLQRKHLGYKAVRLLTGLLVLGGLVAWLVTGSNLQALDVVVTASDIGTRDLPIQYNKSSGVYTIQNEKGTDFRVLQLSDIHLGGGWTTVRQDRNALTAVRALIERTRPDLVIVTGDLLYPIPAQTFCINNRQPVLAFIELMERLGVPWAFTYGNHDTEVTALLNADRLNIILQMCANLGRKNGAMLLFPDIQPPTTGRNDQMLLIDSGGGQTESALFLLDSNAYLSPVGGEYDSIHKDQVAWYKAQADALQKAGKRTVPSFLFFHIPIPAFRQYTAADANYLFGEIGEPGGAICASPDDGGLFDAIVEGGSTRAVFVGHDHLNTLAFRYRGVDLVYGMSIDYLAYPGIDKQNSQRGGTELILHADGTYTIRQIPLF